MFEILDGREYFYQWDINRQIKVNDTTITEIHFSNKTDNEALVCDVYEENGLRVANVPNILLQQEWPIKVYAFATDYTKIEKTFKVIARTKPTDYVYTETEVATWDAFTENINATMEEFAEAEARREEGERYRDNAEAQREENFNNSITNAEEATQAATQATTEARGAAEWAMSAGNAAQKYIDNGYTLFSNALTADKSGRIVRISDISPIQEQIDVKVVSNNPDLDLLTVGVKTRGKNLIPHKYSDTTFTTNGITFTLNEDGTVLAKGTATANAMFFINATTPEGSTLFKAGTYFVSGCPSGGSAYSYYFNVRAQDQSAAYNDTGNGCLMKLEKDTRIVLLVRVNKGTAIPDGILFKPQIELGGQPTGYEKAAAAIDWQVEQDGSIYNFTPFGETTTIEVETPEVEANVKYNRDINKAFEELQRVIISLGGNV